MVFSFSFSAEFGDWGCVRFSWLGRGGGVAGCGEEGLGRGGEVGGW